MKKVKSTLTNEKNAITKVALFCLCVYTGINYNIYERTLCVSLCRHSLGCFFMCPSLWHVLSLSHFPPISSLTTDTQVQSSYTQLLVREGEAHILSVNMSEIWYNNGNPLCVYVCMCLVVSVSEGLTSENRTSLGIHVRSVLIPVYSSATSERVNECFINTEEKEERSRRDGMRWENLRYTYTHRQW